MKPVERNKLSPSREDYLEAILLLVRQGRVARVRDIARHMGVGMSSVTAAMKALSSLGLVNYDPYELITLTDAGRAKAHEIHRRHEVIRCFLSDVLGLSDESAEANACRMEHAVDNELLGKLILFAEFVRSSSHEGKAFVHSFLEFCEQGGNESTKTSGGAQAKPHTSNTEHSQ